MTDHTSPLMTPDATPEAWPPQRGDVWRDRDGTVWFAVRLVHPELDDGEDVALVADQVDGVEPVGEDAEDVRRWWGPLTLAYRAPAEQDGDADA